MSHARVIRYIAIGTMILVGMVNSASPLPRHAIAMAAATPGCGQSWTPGTDITSTLTWDGMQRTYMFHIPVGYSPTTPLPLIFNLPGTVMTGWDEAMLSQMSLTADFYHFVVVYPTGTQNPLTWNTGVPGNPASKVDDVGFLNALVSVLEGELCIDTTRIGMAGMSVGGAMAYHMACSHMPWLTAIAPVSASLPIGQPTCVMARHTPLVAFNGMLDPIIPYSGTGTIPSIPQQLQDWAKANVCPSTGKRGFAKGDVVETVYTPCANNADTELYTVTDGGHQWPGGLPLVIPGWPPLGKTTYVINASQLIYQFVQTHPIP